MFKKLFGLAPKLESDGSYSPSRLALKLATSDSTDFKNISYAKYRGSRSRILVILTEQKNMRMQNGKLFSTGNHPVEVFLPMLHLKNAGFDFDIATPSGKPAVLEMWAYPQKDEAVSGIYNEFKSSLEQPLNLQELSDGARLNAESYAAVFVPGGHGVMLGIPEDENVGSILNWAHDNDVFTITLCHGPGSLLSTTLDGRAFPYAGSLLSR